MPTNDKNYQGEYQRQYRDKTAKTRKVISVSMPIADHDEIARYAKSQDMSVSKLLREATLHQTRGTQINSKQVEEELRALKFLITNISNNVNQMAYHSNRMKQVADENAVFQELKRLDDLISDFTRKRMQNR